MPPPNGQSVRWNAVLGWAVYLAVSWTWCIGMFLPILLLRDFGWPGYLTFAIPNVVGAAAMGWVVLSPEASHRFVARHRLACVAFSAITVAFHLAFVMLVIHPLEGLRTGVMGSLGVLVAPLLLSWFDRPRLIALVAYGISIGVVLAVMSRVGLPVPQPDAIANETLRDMRLPEFEVLFLAPTCVFGFLLCPYLDLTFHKARQHLQGKESGLGFGLGFGLFFLAMILFTTGYAPIFTPQYAPAGPTPRRWLLDALVLHLSAQAAATITFHLRSLRAQSAGSLGRGAFSSLVATAVLLAGFVLLKRDDVRLPPSLTDPAEKLIWYRLFMSFYGLLFPAYVWLIAIPTRDGHAGIGGPEGRRKQLILAGAVVIASPFFWFGFVERQTWWLGPGMAIVLIARVLLTPRSHRRAS